MGIFSTIKDKIFGHDKAKAAKPAPAPAAVAQSAPAPAAVQPTPAPPTPTAAPVAVDVESVLSAMAAMKADGGGNYRTSIVDLLKLLDLDASLSARKELAQELGVNAGEAGSAEQNIALHRAVMDKLAANGGVVPDSLRQ
jgi:hypothetical protein